MDINKADNLFSPQYCNICHLLLSGYPTDNKYIWKMLTLEIDELVVSVRFGGDKSVFYSRIVVVVVCDSVKLNRSLLLCIAGTE